MAAKRDLKYDNVFKEAFAKATSQMTLEEIECERRGYKLTKTILGSGAYAKVKMAYAMEIKQEKNKRLADDLYSKGHNIVAIKIISKRQAPAEYLNKFMPREIEALNATARHHNVIQLYETFQSNYKIFMVMEYASKGDLLDYINSRCRRCAGIGEDLARHFFRQLAEGLSHCHRRNVVHRDLKCENILIDDNNVIKISDFGFATQTPSDMTKLLETFCGSYAYAAPEILKAEKYDGKCADVWSLGIMLYAMMCGKLPYNDNCSLHSLILQTKAKLTFPTRGACSPECQKLIREILKNNPSDRITINRILVDPWLNEGRQETPRTLLKKGMTPMLSPHVASLREMKGQRAQSGTQDAGSKTPEPSQNRSARSQTPVAVQGWSSKPTTPEPSTVTKLLHKRNAKRQACRVSNSPVPEPSPVVESIPTTPIDDIAERLSPSVQGRSPACARSLTPGVQTKTTNRKELPVKVARIITGLEVSKESKNLSREKFVTMNRATHELQQYKQVRNDLHQTRQQVWRYVNAISSHNNRFIPTREMKSSVVKSGLLLRTVCLETPPESKKFSQPGVAPWKRVIVHQRPPGKPPMPSPQKVKREVKRSSAKSGNSPSVFLDDMISSSPMNKRPVRGVLCKQRSPRISTSPARRVTFSPNHRL